MRISAIVDQLLIEPQQIKYGQIYFSLQIEKSKGPPALSSRRACDDIDFSGEILTADISDKQTDVFVLYLAMDAKEFSNVVRSQKLAFLRFPLAALPERDYAKGHFTFSLLPNSVLKAQPKVTLFLQITEASVTPFKNANRGKIDQQIYKIFNYGVGVSAQNDRRIERRSTVCRKPVKRINLNNGKGIRRPRASVKIKSLSANIYQSISTENRSNSTARDSKIEEEFEAQILNTNMPLDNASKEATELVMKQVNRRFWNVLTDKKFIVACAEYLSKVNGFENLDESIQNFLILQQNNELGKADNMNQNDTKSLMCSANSGLDQQENVNEQNVNSVKEKKSKHLLGEHKQFDKNETNKCSKSKNDVSPKKKKKIVHNMDPNFTQSAPAFSINNDYLDTPPFLNDYSNIKSIDPPPFN